MARKKPITGIEAVLGNSERAAEDEFLAPSTPVTSNPNIKSFSSIDRSFTGKSDVSLKVQSTRELKEHVEKLSSENEKLANQVGTVTRKMPTSGKVVRFRREWIDTNLIDVSPKNRRIQSLLTLASVSDIFPSIQAGEQSVPATLKPIEGGRYILADGSRRLFCATTLGRKLLADIGDIPDEDIEELSAIENLAKKLSDYEMAMYQDNLLQQGLYSSWNEIGKAFNLSKGQQTRQKALACLNFTFIRAFADPNTISGDMAAKIASMCESHTEANKTMLDLAEEIYADKMLRIESGAEQLSPSEVINKFQSAVNILLEKDASKRRTKVIISKDKKRSLKYGYSNNGKSIKLQLTGLPNDLIEEIITTIKNAAELN